MTDIAIRCEGLSKQYRIGERKSYKALRDVITDADTAPFPRLRSAFDRRQQTVDRNGAGVPSPVFGSCSNGRPSSVTGQASGAGHRASVVSQPSADGSSIRNSALCHGS